MIGAHPHSVSAQDKTFSISKLKGKEENRYLWNKYKIKKEKDFANSDNNNTFRYILNILHLLISPNVNVNGNLAHSVDKII